MVTDFDCWHPDHDHVQVADIVRVLIDNAERAKTLVTMMAPRLKAGAAGPLPARLRPRARARADHAPAALGARSRSSSVAGRMLKLRVAKSSEDRTGIFVANAAML